MHKTDLVPVFYQGQANSYPGAEPDHYVSRQEMRRGLEARDYMSIHRGKALLKLTTCLPKYPNHQDSIKAGWQGVSLNIHSFKFKRDYGALQRSMGPRVMQLVKASTKRKHTKTCCLQTKTPLMSTQRRCHCGECG